MAITTMVFVGDKFRISTELLKQIADMPNGTSEVVELVEVRVESDDTKTLVVKRAL